MLSEPTDPTRIVSAAVSEWMEHVQALHAQVQTAMEAIREQPGLGPEAQLLIGQLLIVLRQRQAQTPTQEMVRTWVRVLTQD